jgi:hypothetical protein
MNSLTSGKLLCTLLAVFVLMTNCQQGAAARAGRDRSLLPLTNIQNIQQQINTINMLTLANTIDNNNENENENENENQNSNEIEQTEVTKSIYHLPADHSDIVLPSKQKLTANEINEWIDSNVFELTKQNQIMYHWMKTIGGE